MVRTKFYILTAKFSDISGFSFFIDMPARPVKGDTFIFNETIQGLEELGEEKLSFLREFEFGIQAASWQFDEKGPFLELTIEPTL